MREISESVRVVPYLVKVSKENMFTLSNQTCDKLHTML